MSAPMPLVLGVSAVVASPVARLLYDGDLGLDTALLRVALVVGIVWALMSVVAGLLVSPPKRPETPPAVAEPEHETA